LAPATDLTPAGHRQNAVLVDVTSLIGAEEFIVAQNNHRALHDPFGRQSFAEIIQSLIFMSEVYVVHPMLAAPRETDFGVHPHLLQALLSRGLLRPLSFDQSSWLDVQTLEASAIRDLQSANGFSSVMRFVTQARLCDEASSRAISLSGRIRGWSEFEAAQVHGVPGHREARIQTHDGIEDDEFGDWAKAAARVLRETLVGVAASGAEARLMAALARGIKYRTRAQVANLSYQSHAMRRDFLLTFDLTRDGAADASILDVIKLVRGIQESLVTAGDEALTPRLKIVELELPLLGGRLWDSAETGRRPDIDWIELVADRIAEYREHARELRSAIEGCVIEEDYLRLVRDIAAVQQKLLERFGLRSIDLSPVERELVNGVASVTEAIPGVPKVSGLWISGRSIGKRYVYSGEPFQRFLYKEFVKAWKRAGR
jgi:hypothetical protein